MDIIYKRLTPSTHSTSHVTGASDEIDGDKLDIDWTPSSYTPTTVEGYADHADNLTSHLKGVDSAISGKSDTNHTHDYAASSHSHSESDITDLGSYATSDHNHDLAYSGIAHTHSYASDNHDATHITGASDAIDGDKLEISWNPSNYTPSTVESYADSVDNLTAHLKGIDSAIGSSTGMTAGKSIALTIVFS